MSVPPSISIISADVGHTTSGQSRFAINIAKGLSRLGSRVRVVCAQVLPTAESDLRRENVTCLTLGRNTLKPTFQARLITRWSSVGRDLARLAVSAADADWYVVLSDSAISSSAELTGLNSVYITNGDLSLMFLNRHFYDQGGLIKHLLSLQMSGFVRRNAGYASKFSLRLANSEFTRKFMSYLYRIPFTGVVYPPVDLSFFKPSKRQATEPYLFALARNQSEEGIDLLESVASRVRLRVAGGANVRGAVNLGVVSDTVLAELFANAEATIFPGVAEFFGYTVAESLASGTPALGFDCSGPAELITPGEVGVLVRSEAAFVREAERFFSRRTSAEVRQRARESAARFSIEVCSKALLGAIQS